MHRITLAVATAALFAPIVGCDFLDVDNPTSVELDELNTAVGAEALLNGAEWSLATALGTVVAVSGTVADELMWVGSRQAWLQLDEGQIVNPGNQFIDTSFEELARARWSAEQAMVANPQSARASSYFATTLLLVVENFDDFVLPPGLEPVPPVGPERMSELLETAETVLSSALTFATDPESITVITALRARTRHAQGVWRKLNPAGANPADPLVASGDAAADAMAVLESASTDWRWTFAYSDETTQMSEVARILGSQVQIATPYVTLDPSGPGGVGDVVLLDPVSGLPDPTLATAVAAFSGVRHPELTVVSSREMRLLVAEHALAVGDTAAFDGHMDLLRSQDGKPPRGGLTSRLELLEHERRVQLFLQGRRWLDHYRFGSHSDEWRATSDAALIPGTLLPIGESERSANPFVGAGG